MHAVLDESLDLQALGERRGEHNPGVRDDPLVVKGDLHIVQSDRPAIINHQGGGLTPGPAAHTAWKSPAQEVILVAAPDRTGLPAR